MDADDLLYYHPFCPPHRKCGRSGEYRRKLALTREGNLAPLPEEREEPEAPRLHLVAVQDRRARNSNRAARRAWALDICASMGVLLMTLTFTLRVLAV